MILEIISPEKIIFTGEVESVAVPGVNGEFEMLNNHAAIVSNLKKGAIKMDLLFQYFTNISFLSMDSTKVMKLEQKYPNLG